jgi:hypothetical protein
LAIGLLTLNNRIPPADPAKDRCITDGQKWRNPYLIVQAKGIDPWSMSPATKIPTMSPADVVAYLKKLASSAWPYGLVVAVQENGLRASGDDARIKRNRENWCVFWRKLG